MSRSGAGKVWFITGTSRGFGREWATAALERGDRVAATARSVDQIQHLVDVYGPAVLPMELDVTDRARVFAAIRRTTEHFGTLDVVVNNAGYGHFGMVEELSEDDIRAQLETNFLGALWVTQAALPIMRAQGSGHIIQVTSEGGILAFPGIGAYHASKWALEGLTQSLALEVEGFGIHVTNLEPGPYSTDWLAVGARQSPQNPDYRPVREAANSEWDVGDPTATRDAILELVDMHHPPLRILFGKSLAAVTAEYQQRLRVWREHQDISLRAFGGKNSLAR
jgi:NAD(P)-dependent dehydrogenase (short-subunit alcohol dehydrogenase family)